MEPKMLSTEVVSGPVFSMELDLDAVELALRRVRQFQAIVKKLLVSGVDYGPAFPGSKKDTLLKPGAEKIAKIMRLTDTYEVVEKMEDYDKPLFAYTVRCSLQDMNSGVLVSQGMGQCNTYETRYRYRWVFESELPAKYDPEELATRKGMGKNGREYVQYRIENDEVYSLVNTVLKQAVKRALVAASLSAGRLSDIFTQDLEDIDVPDGDEDDERRAKQHDVPISEPQRKKLFAVAGEIGVSAEDLKAWLGKTYGSTQMIDVKKSQFDAVLKWLESQRGKKGKPQGDGAEKFSFAGERQPGQEG